MPDYQPLGVPTDPQDTLAEMIADLEARIPGWHPAPTSLVVQQFEIVALQIARLGAALEDTAREAFVNYGVEILQEPMHVETHPHGLVTFTSPHTDGAYIPAGTIVTGDDGAGGEVVFATTSDAIIPAGYSTVAAVPVEAVEPGQIMNPVSGSARLDSRVEGVNAVAFDDPSTTGADGETVEEYAERLAQAAQLLTKGPVTPSDYNLLLRVSLPAVHRVLIRNLYNPDDSTDDNAGMLTVSMIDETGTYVGSVVDAEAEALIAQHREINDIVHVVTPTTSVINVDYEIIVEDGYDAAETIARCDAALTDYLDPASWGQPPISDEPQWVLKKTLRPMGMLGPIIGTCEGVESVELVKAAITGNATSTNPLTLPGHAPLTSVGAISGTEAS